MQNNLLKPRIIEVEPLGLGHAVLVTRDLVGDEPFAVILGDDVIDADPPALKQMIDVYERLGGPVLAVERVPWAGHSALYAIPEIYQAIGKARMTLVFVNTRSQAEIVFQALWTANEDGLAIALHHGSLDVGQRRKVEAAMAAGRLKAVVCTSTLDLGIDWGDVDLVINVGAPKGSSRLMQRIGRANHRIDEASRAVLVPANRFEVLECAAAIEAVAENAQDTPPQRKGSLDVLAQQLSQTPSRVNVNRRIQGYHRQMLQRYPHQLSGGQRQRVMIAMALACNPALLIADEPTADLDAESAKKVMTQLRSLNCGVIVITHDVELLEANDAIVRFER